MSSNPFMKKEAERCTPVSKEGRSRWTKNREPSLSVVICNRSEIVPGDRFTKVILDRKGCRSWEWLPDWENCVPYYQIVYTDGSVQRGVKSGCRYTASLHCEVVKQDSGYIPLTSSICVEIKAITEILEWSRHQAITRPVCLTDSMSNLVKISSGMLHTV